MTDITVADWLAEAGDYLEHNGWWRNSMLGPNRRQACATDAGPADIELSKSPERSGP